MEEQKQSKKLIWSKHVFSLHQLAAFEDYLMKLTDEECENELLAINATLLGMHPISYKMGGFDN
jgi:hypothetical protein|tara:strand:+ start:27612 stop:27803 length:192 start_codon:yes stop_codon:yes gene_type:complete